MVTKNMQMPAVSNAKALYFGACLFFFALTCTALYGFINTQKIMPIAPLASAGDALSNEISPYHLFGQKPSINLNVSDSNTQSRDISRLNLQVTGILASNVEELSQATLKMQGQKEKNYRIGDAIQGDDNIVLTAINANDISINNTGVAQLYTIIRPPLKSNKLATQLNTNVQVSDASVIEVGDMADEDSVGSPSMDEMMRAEDSELGLDDIDVINQDNNAIYQATDPEELRLIADRDGDLPGNNDYNQPNQAQNENSNAPVSERVNVNE